MTIRDIAVAFGIEVDQKSVSAAENAIKGVKNMASKLLGAIGIGFSIAGIANLAEAAADAEALKSQFSQVFGDLEQDASDKLDKIADDTGVTVNSVVKGYQLSLEVLQSMFNLVLKMDMQLLHVLIQKDWWVYHRILMHILVI